MIKLIDGYALTSDNYCITLGIPENKIIMGKECIVMKNPTYHATIGNALQSLYRSRVRDYIRSNDETLSTALLHVEGIEKRMRELVAEPDFMKGIEND